MKETLHRNRKHYTTLERENVLRINTSNNQKKNTKKRKGSTIIT